MKTRVIHGVALNGLGATLLGYVHFSATTEANILQFETLTGWTLIGGGVKCYF